MQHLGGPPRLVVHRSVDGPLSEIPLMQLSSPSLPFVHSSAIARLIYSQEKATDEVVQACPQANGGRARFPLWFPLDFLLKCYSDSLLSFV